MAVPTTGTTLPIPAPAAAPAAMGAIDATPLPGELAQLGRHALDVRQQTALDGIAPGQRRCRVHTRTAFAQLAAAAGVGVVSHQHGAGLERAAERL